MRTLVKHPSESRLVEVKALKKGGVEIVELKKGGVSYYKKKYALDQQLQHVTMVCSEPYYHQDWIAVLTAEAGYQILPSTVKVTMDGTDITDSTYNYLTNTITIPNVTGSISICAEAAIVDSAYQPLLYIATRTVKAGNRIILPYHPNTNTRLVMDVKLALKSYSSLYSVGIASATSPNYFFMMCVHNTTVWRVKHGTYHQDTTSDVKGRMKSGKRITFINDKGIISYENKEGNKFTRNCSTNAFNLSGNNLGIMTYGSSGSESAHMSCDGNVYGVEVSEPTNDDANILLDYVPVERLSDGAVGIYDIVNGNAIINTNYIKPYVTLSTTLTNCMASLLSANGTGTTSKAVIGSTWSIKITPNTDYSFVDGQTDPVVTFDGVDVSSDTSKVTITYDSNDNSYIVTIINVPWNVAIGISATAYA